MHLLQAHLVRACAWASIMGMGDSREIEDLLLQDNHHWKGGKIDHDSEKS